MIGRKKPGLAFWATVVVVVIVVAYPRSFGPGWRSGLKQRRLRSQCRSRAPKLIPFKGLLRCVAKTGPHQSPAPLPTLDLSGKASDFVSTSQCALRNVAHVVCCWRSGAGSMPWALKTLPTDLSEM